MERSTIFNGKTHYFDWAMRTCHPSFTGWWYTYPSKKGWSESQLGWLFHSQYDGKVRIHSMVPVTTNELMMLLWNITQNFVQNWGPKLGWPKKILRCIIPMDTRDASGIPSRAEFWTNPKPDIKTWLQYIYPIVIPLLSHCYPSVIPLLSHCYPHKILVFYSHSLGLTRFWWSIGTNPFYPHCMSMVSLF